MKKELEQAINRLINEWCDGCNHNYYSGIKNRHCNLEDLKEHCAIANLIYLLKNNFNPFDKIPDEVIIKGL